MQLEAVYCLGMTSLVLFDQILCLFLVLIEIGMIWKLLTHTKLLSRSACRPPIRLKEVRTRIVLDEGGHGPFRGLDAPFLRACEFTSISMRRSIIEVSV